MELFDPFRVVKEKRGKGDGEIPFPGLHPGLFGLDSFGVLWIPAFAGMTTIRMGSQVRQTHGNYTGMPLRAPTAATVCEVPSTFRWLVAATRRTPRMKCRNGEGGRNLPCRLVFFEPFPRRMVGLSSKIQQQSRRDRSAVGSAKGRRPGVATANGRSAFSAVPRRVVRARVGMIGFGSADPGLDHPALHFSRHVHPPF
jgi:hypothetical protein